MAPSAPPLPIGPTIYYQFDDSGSSSASFHFEAATPDYFFRLMPICVRARHLPLDEKSDLTVLRMTNLHPSKGKKAYVVCDEFTIDGLGIGTGTIIDAKRQTIAPTGKPIEVEGIPTGAYLWAWPSGSDPTIDRETISCTPEEKQAEQSKARSLIQSFGETYLPLIEDRIKAVGRAFPIQASSFFDYNFTIGTIFREQFAISALGSCCDPTAEPGAGFRVHMQTDHFEIAFSYTKHNAQDRVWHNEHADTATLRLSRANSGFEFSLDEALHIRAIQEIGAPNMHVGSHYGPEEFQVKGSLASQIHERGTQIMEELRPKLKLEERTAFCDSLTPDGLDHIMRQLEYIGNVRTPRELRMEAAIRKMQGL